MAEKTSKIPAEVRKALPEQYRNKAVISFSKQSDRYYAYLLLGSKYDPKKKRWIDKRLPLGSIKDEKFTYSPTFLREQQIQALSKKLKTEEEKHEQKLKELSQKKEVEKKALQEKNKQVTEVAVKAINQATSKIQEVRQIKKTTYPIGLLLAVCLLASLAGYTSSVGVAGYWKQFHANLRDIFPGLPNETPSHDTVNRLLRLIEPAKFTSLLSLLGLPELKKARHIHIDGQAVRASKTKNCPSGRYVFNAYDSKNHFFITQELINEKANEITHAKSLLESLNLSEHDVFTSDALNTQKELVRYARNKKAHYCLAVKKNQKSLYNSIQENILLHGSQAFKTEKIEAGHGRVETRTASILPAKVLPETILKQWDGLRDGSIVATTTLREFKGGVVDNADTCQTRYFITSLSCNKQQDAEDLTSLIRNHWSIENCLHWVLDVQFNEDRIQATNPNYISNRTLLNKNALNVLSMAQKNYKQNDNLKLSIRSLMQLCSNPYDALETLSRAIDQIKTF